MDRETIVLIFSWRETEQGERVVAHRERRPYVNYIRELSRRKEKNKKERRDVITVVSNASFVEKKFASRTKFFFFVRASGQNGSVFGHFCKKGEKWQKTRKMVIFGRKSVFFREFLVAGKKS